MALVCSCHGVNTRTIKEEIARGAATIDEIGMACSAGTCCRGCHPTIDALLDEHCATADTPAMSRVRVRRRRAPLATA